jgi:hypothetical protein
MTLLRIFIAIFAVSLLAACGGSDPAALKEEACGAFTRGVDRLNVDDTAYESFNKAYEAFNKLAKNDEFYVRFGNIAYQLTDPKSLVAWSDIDEVAAYCGDPVFTD